VDRSSTLQKIAHVLAEAGATRKAIRDALADRDISLGYRKFSGRPDERTEVEYRRSANKAVREAEARRSVVIVPEGGDPGVFDARWLLAEEFPPIRWVVPDVLPEGVTILAGKPKLGKSWLAMDLCLGVAQGGAVLGTKRVEGGPCLYLALEDSPRRLQRRLRGLVESDGVADGGEYAPEGFEFATAWPRIGEDCEERLRAWLESRPGAKLVVSCRHPEESPP
jgi:AAA domain